MKEMEVAAKNAQKKAAAAKTELSNLKSQKEKLVAEISLMLNDEKAQVDQYAICEKGIVRISKEVNQLESALADKREQYDAAKKAVTAMQTQLNQQSKEIKALESSKDKLNKSIQSISLDCRKLTHKRDQFTKETKDAAKRLTDMVKKYPWIQTEKAYFGVPGSDYDFAGKDLKQCTDRLSHLKSAQVCCLLDSVNN